jgi:hypothetical protein
MNGTGALPSLAWVLSGYIALQILLNVANYFLISRARHRMIALLKCAFWSTVVNALYFLTCAVLMRIYGLVTVGDPGGPLALQALAGVPAGVVLWYLSTQGRKAGRELFGRSELSLAEESILRAPPGLRYISWGVLNLAILQPLGRELFLRGTFLAVVVRELGWGWGIGGTLLIELLLRLEIGWVFFTLLYAGVQLGLFAMTGNALCGLVAAMVAGLLQSAALLRTGVMRKGKGAES